LFSYQHISAYLIYSSSLARPLAFIYPSEDIKGQSNLFKLTQSIPIDTFLSTLTS